MKKRSAGVLILFVLTALIFLRAEGAGAQPPRLKAFLLASQAQAQILHGIIGLYGNAVLHLKNAEQEFESCMTSFDRLARELKPLLNPDSPGNENLSKYYDMLLIRKRTVMKDGKRLLEKEAGRKKLGRADIEPLEKAAFRTVYAARQLMRHLVRNMETGETGRKDRERMAEALLLSEMEGHLLNSIKDSFADNINCNSSPADTFWLDLASFDILATVYSSGVFSSDSGTAEKTGALKSLVSLKHDVLMEGEALYLVAKTCRPDLEAAKVVADAAGRLLPIFETLIREALK